MTKIFAVLFILLFGFGVFSAIQMMQDNFLVGLFFAVLSGLVIYALVSAIINDRI